MRVTRRVVLQSAVAGGTAARTFAANDKVQVGFIGCGARAHELLGALGVQLGAAIT